MTETEITVILYLFKMIQRYFKDESKRKRQLKKLKSF